MFDNAAEHFASLSSKGGLELCLKGYDENLCIPKTQIKVNGKHNLRIHMGLKSD